MKDKDKIINAVPWEPPFGSRTSSDGVGVGVRLAMAMLGELPRYVEYPSCMAIATLLIVSHPNPRLPSLGHLLLPTRDRNQVAVDKFRIPLEEMAAWVVETMGKGGLTNGKGTAKESSIVIH